MSPLRQSLVLTAVALLGFLALRSLPDTHCALLHAEHEPVVVDGLEFCGVNEEANFYRPRDLKFPYALKVERTLRVADEVAPLAREVEEAFARARLVVLSGGLGPTPDDVTREAVALALVLALLSAGLFYLLDRGRGRFG
mgnify:CR=1 FL=1